MAATPSRLGSVTKQKRIKVVKIGEQAPDFSLEDQFGRKVELSRFRGRSNVLLLFYPLDWTPT